MAELEIFRSEKFLALPVERQLGVRKALRRQVTSSVVFKALSFEQRKSILDRIFPGGTIGPQEEGFIPDAKRVLGDVFERLLPEPVGQQLRPELAAGAGAIVRGAIRGTTIGMINPPEPEIGGGLEATQVAESAAISGSMATALTGLLPFKVAGRIVKPIAGLGARLIGLPATGRAARIATGSGTFALPTAVATGGDPGEVARSALVGSIAGLPLGVLATTAGLVGAEAALPHLGEAANIDLGETASTEQLITLGLFGLLGITAKGFSPRVQRAMIKGLVPGKPLIGSQQEIIPPVSRAPSAPRPVDLPGEELSPKPAPEAPAKTKFRVGDTVQAKGVIGNVQRIITTPDDVVAMIRLPSGASARVPLSEMKIFKPTTQEPPADTPVSQRVDLRQTTDNISRLRSAVRLGQLEMTPGELRGLLRSERNVRDKLEVMEDIRKGRRPSQDDLDVSDATLQRARGDLTRIVQRRQTIAKLAGQPGAGLSRKEVESILAEKLEPVYQRARQFDAELAADVQAAKRHIENTTKEVTPEGERAPLEAGVKAKMSRTDRPTLSKGEAREIAQLRKNEKQVMRALQATEALEIKDPNARKVLTRRLREIRDKLKEVENFVKVVDPRHSIPQTVKVSKVIPRITTRRQTIGPEGLRAVEMELRALAEGAELRPEQQSRLDFNVSWEFPRQPNLILEKMGFTPAEEIRIMSEMNRRIPGWSSMVKPIAEVEIPARENEAVEKMQQVVDRPEGTPPVVGLPTADTGKLTSRPDSASIAIVQEARKPIEKIADPIVDGMTAERQVRYRDLLGEIKEVEKTQAEANRKRLLKEPNAEEELARIGSFKRQLQDSLALAQQPAGPVPDAQSLSPTRISDTFVQKMREMRPAELKQFVDENPLVFQGPGSVAMRRRMQEVLQAALASEKFEAREVVQLERISQRLALVRKKPVSEVVTEAERGAIARQTGLPLEGFEVKAFEEVERLPARPIKVAPVESRSSLIADAEDLGYKVDFIEGKFSFGGQTFETFKDARLTLDIYRAARQQSLGPGAAGKGEFLDASSGKETINVRIDAIQRDIENIFRVTQKVDPELGAELQRLVTIVTGNAPSSFRSAITTEKPGFLSPEELRRGENFYKVSRSGQLTFMGKQPDAPLKPQEGVVAINSQGELRLEAGDNRALERAKTLSLKAPKPTEEPTTITVRPPVRTDRLNPGLINNIAADRGAEIVRVDGGWILRDYREGTQEMFLESKALPENGYRAVVEKLRELPVQEGPDFTPPDGPRVISPRGPRPGDSWQGGVIRDPGAIALLSNVRAMRNTMLTIEKQLKIPAWSKVFKPIDEAIQSNDAFTAPHQKRIRKILSKVRKNEMEAVQDYITTNAENRPAAAERWHMRNKVQRAADELVIWYNDFLTKNADMTDAGVRNLREFVMPRMRRADGDIDVVFNDFNLPREISSWGRFLRDGDLQIHGTNAGDIAGQILRIVGRQKFIDPVWQEARTIVDAKARGPDGEPRFIIPPTIRKVMKGYLDVALNIPAESTMQVDEAIGAFFKKGFGLGMSRETRSKLANVFLTAHTAGAMFFRPGLATRNLLQSGLAGVEVSPIALAKGGIPFVTDVRNWAEANRELRLHTQDSIPWEIEASQTLGSTWDGVRRTGMFLYRGADQVNRVISYGTGKWAIETHGAQWAQGKITRQEFLQLTGLARQYEPVRNFIMEFLENRPTPDIARAAIEYGKHVAGETQFPYRRGNEPSLGRGFWGKMFGRYGIWPVNIIELIWRNSFARTGANTSDRAIWLARMAAYWTGIEFMLEDVIGAESTRWAWINPFFSGGPTFQALTSAYSMLGSTDFERRIAWERLKRNAYSHIPFYMAGRDVQEMFDEENPEDIIKQFFNMTPQDPEDNELLLPSLLEAAAETIMENL